MNEEQILQVFEAEKQREQLVELATDRAHRLLNALGKGFGNANQFESAELVEDGIEIVFLDAYYDLLDTCFVKVTLKELFMSEEEFSIYINKLSEDRLKKKELENKKSKENYEKAERERYEKLKEKYG